MKECFKDKPIVGLASLRDDVVETSIKWEDVAKAKGKTRETFIVVPLAVEE